MTKSPSAGVGYSAAPSSIGLAKNTTAMPSWKFHAPPPRDQRARARRRWGWCATVFSSPFGCGFRPISDIRMSPARRDARLLGSPFHLYLATAAGVLVGTDTRHTEKRQDPKP